MLLVLCFPYPLNQRTVTEALCPAPPPLHPGKTFRTAWAPSSLCLVSTFSIKLTGHINRAGDSPYALLCYTCGLLTQFLPPLYASEELLSTKEAERAVSEALCPRCHTPTS